MGLEEMIDSTMVTIIIGLITGFGILLTFYQFVASLNEDMYIGIRVSGLYYRNASLERVISSKLFILIMIIEILCLPMKYLFQNCKINECDKYINIFFYCVAVLSSLLYMLFFWKSAVIMMNRGRWPEEYLRGEVLRKINKEIVSRGKRELIKGKNFNILKDTIVLIVNKHGDKATDVPIYYQLINELFMINVSYFYKNRKKGVKNGRYLLWRKENYILDAFEIMLNNPMVFDRNMIRFVFKMYKDFLSCFFDEKLKNEYSELDFYGGGYSAYLGEGKKLDVKRADDLLKKIYKLSTCDDLIEILKELHLEEMHSTDTLMRDFCQKEIRWIMHEICDEVFAGIKSTKELNLIFNQLSRWDEYNDAMVYIIADCLICYKEYDDEHIVDLLNASNCTYLFIFLIAFYSVNKSRNDWTIMCLRVLKSLWDKHEKLEKSEKRIIDMVGKTNYSYRITESVVHDCILYIKSRNNPETLMNIKNSDEWSVFYLFAIKTCVLEQRFDYYEKLKDRKIIIELINELSRHAEVISFRYMKETINSFQIDYFRKIESLPYEFNRSLRVFVILDINITDDFLDRNEQLKYSNALGEYLLVKCRSLVDIRNREKYIIRAYEAHDVSIAEYISWLGDECAACSCILKHAQKTAMENYLEDLLI